MEIRKDTPVVVYKGKETPLEPFMIFTHEQQRFMASGWDTDEDGDDAFLTYAIQDPNRVMLGKENYAQPNEKIPVDCLPYIEKDGWEYIEEEDIADVKHEDVTGGANGLRNKLAAAREKVAEQQEENEKIRADISKTKPKDKVLDGVEKIDDRSPENVGPTPTNDVLDDEIFDKSLILDDDEVEKDSLVQSFLGANDDGDDDDDGADIPDDMLDAIMAEFDSERVVKQQKQKIVGNPTTLRKKIKDDNTKAVDQYTRRKELEESGHSEVGTNQFDEEIRARKRYKDELDKELCEVENAIHTRKKALAELEYQHKSSFRDTPTIDHKSGLEGLLNGRKNANTTDRGLQLQSGNGFSKIIAIQQLNPDLIMENAELIVSLINMSPQQKVALRTIADTIRQITG